MTKTIKVALAGAGAFGLKHLDAIKLIDGVEAVSLVGRDLDKTKEAAAQYGVGHVATDLAESLKVPGLDAVILATPTQMHAAQALQCLKAGKHVQVEIPLADSSEGRRGGGRRAEENRARRHGRPHPPLQPEPSVRAPAHPQGRVPYPADGRADLFLPPHQHERARPGALMDRPSALASRRAHGRSVRLSGALADREGQRGAGADPSDARHRHGHEHPAQGRERRDLHAVAVVQQRRAARHVLPLYRRHARPISPATTTSSPARTRRST